MSEAGAAVDARHRRVADVVAGISVALVLVPQSLAYADLAGMPPHFGLYASALPPLLAAIFASSPYLQTGPTALTSILVFAALSSLAPVASPEYVVLAAMLAFAVGITRVLVGLLRGGTVAYLMSQPVLKGFTAAAALLILSSQLPKVLGVVPGDAGVVARAVMALSDPGAWNFEAIGLSAGTIAAMLGGKRLHPLFPGVLVAVVVGVLYGAFAGYSGPMVGHVPAALIPEVLPTELPWGRFGEVLAPGVIIALVGFAEAASVAQAFAEAGAPPWDPNREFLGQGVANIAAGMTGSFPVGGSFSRSALSRVAGTQTRLSGAVTGVAVLCFLPFAGVLASLPMAVLGAIVVGAVLKLLNPMPLVVLVRQSSLQGGVALGTFGFTLWLAPHIEYAIVAGIALALGVHLWREQRLDVKVEHRPGVLSLTPHGVLFFGSAPLLRQRMLQELQGHPATDEVVIVLRHIGRVDLTGALALQEVIEAAHRGDATVHLVEVPEHALRVLRRVCPDALGAEALDATEQVAGDRGPQSESEKPRDSAADAP